MDATEAPAPPPVLLCYTPTQPLAAPATSPTVGVGVVGGGADPDGLPSTSMMHDLLAISSQNVDQCWPSGQTEVRLGLAEVPPAPACEDE